MSSATDVAAQKAPEIGQSIQTGRMLTNCHDFGTGAPVLLLHGSGPGVSAWANWRLVLPVLAERARVIAPDLAGFGYTKTDQDVVFDIDLWIEQILTLLDKLGVAKTSLVGNSFGGAMALHFAARYPERVERIVLMGSVGASFPLTYGLDRVWGYGGLVEEMRDLIRIFVYDQTIVTEDLVQLRYAASIRDDVQTRFSSLFPAPRQRWVDALALEDNAICALSMPILLIHGANDAVVPLECSRTLAAKLPKSHLVEIDKCGHWVQIEQTARFVKEVCSFLELNDEKGARS